MRTNIWIAILAVALIAAPNSFSQTTTAMLRGTVLDPSSTAVPGAEVTVVNTDTGLHRTAPTNEAGAYVIADLPYGPYRVSVV